MIFNATKKPLCRVLAALMVYSVAMGGLTIKGDNASVKSDNFSVTEISSQGTEYSLKASVGDYALFLNEKRGDFYIKNSLSQTIWKSVPDYFFQLPNVKATLKKQVLSNLVLKILDVSASDDSLMAYSYSDSTMSSGMKITDVKNGVCITYSFPDYGITVPLMLNVTSRGFNASIDTDGIKEEDSENYKVVQINLLPYFNAGSAEEDGFLLVPDGCGAVINFNNGRDGVAEYNSQVYGRDYAVHIDSLSTVEQAVCLPVFSVAHTEQFSMAVINSSAASANIAARSSTASNPFNYAYAQFTIRTKEYLRSGDRWSDVLLYQKDALAKQHLEVAFSLEKKSQATYTDVALLFKKYLTDVDGLKTSDETDGLIINITGATVGKKLMLGVPVNRISVLTDYENAKDIACTLEKENINGVIYNYKKWSNASAKKSVAASGGLYSLGGKKKLNLFIEEIQNSGNKVFLDVDPIRIYSNKNLFSIFIDYAQTMFNAEIELLSYMPNTNQADEDARIGHLIRQSKMKKNFQKWGSIIGDYSVDGIGISGTNTLYTDFRISGTSRNDTVGVMVDGLNSIKDDGMLLIDGGNYYTLKYADILTNVPSTSSLFDIENEAVPFYQIALHGIVPYASEAINAQSNYTDAYLHSVETGAMLSFNLISADSGSLQNTEDSDLFYAKSDRWLPEIVDMYKKYGELYKSTVLASIVCHRSLTDGVYLTAYKNGVCSIVNYNGEAVETEYGKVEGKDFIVVNEDDQGEKSE